MLFIIKFVVKMIIRTSSLSMGLCGFLNCYVIFQGVEVVGVKMFLKKNYFLYVRLIQVVVFFTLLYLDNNVMFMSYPLIKCLLLIRLVCFAHAYGRLINVDMNCCSVSDSLFHGGWKDTWVVLYDNSDLCLHKHQHDSDLKARIHLRVIQK